MKTGWEYQRLTAVGVAIALCACGDGDGTGPGGGVGNTDFEASEDFSIGVPVTNQSSFALTGINGNLAVSGDPAATSVTVAGTKTVESSSVADAEAFLDRASVDVSSTSAVVTVETEQPGETGGRNVSVDYRITVPSALRVTVANADGDIEIGGLDSGATVTNANGNVDLDAVDGDVVATLANGNIEIAAMTGSVLAATTNGNASVEVISLPIGGELDLRTANGNVQAMIPRNTSANVAALVRNGRISVSDLSWTSVVQTPTTLAGILGAGEATIELLTVNGDIELSGI